MHIVSCSVMLMVMVVEALHVRKGCVICSHVSESQYLVFYFLSHYKYNAETSQR